jgi:hypothetical protein
LAARNTTVAASARRLLERFDPKYGSWLDLTEPELDVLFSRRFDLPLSDKQMLGPVYIRSHARILKPVKF